jgi:hypothetical protein
VGPAPRVEGVVGPLGGGAVVCMMEHIYLEGSMGAR